MQLFTEVSFEAAHRLPNVPEGHKCSRVHGHSYRVQLHIRGPVNPKTGWVIDLGDIDAAFAPLRAQLDHHYLNDVEGLENPTCENLAKWIWKRLRPSLPLLFRIQVSETTASSCIYEGEDE
ncbi:6-carboxytetrahydropterin synthase QueD [Hyalangium gracile]|uniref:6-carboxytetrahydropterin synthase QueD n=1 Tax=Hyalangium gracile TaxID=394092 RepID=UPI001CCE54BE|nr:6-carboxytetrahydropterin synthase QueD [Hyalangium gracile]